MATVMELMREMKTLTTLRQAGQVLSADQEQRLKEIRAILEQQMGKSGPGAAVGGAPRPAATAKAPPAKGGMSTNDALSAFRTEEARGDPNAFKLAMPDELGAEVNKLAAKADAALAATKKRARAKDADDAIKQLEEIAQTNMYTPADAALAGDYFSPGDGYELMPEADIELELIDPRAEELARAQAEMQAVGALGITNAAGCVFLDDFVELYTSGLLSIEPLDADDEGDSNDPSLIIPGKRKVTVHMANGEVKRGIITKLSRQDPGFTLLPQGPGKAEPLSIQQIKAIFINLNPGVTPPPPPPGKNVTATFKDRRTVQGVSSDLGQGPCFTLYPPPGRGGVERIIINQAQCLEVR